MHGPKISSTESAEIFATALQAQMDHCVFAGGARSATNELTDQARRTMLLLWTTDQWGPVVRGCTRSEIASREYPFASQQKLEMGVKLIASSAIHNESAEPQFILGPRAHTSAHDMSRAVRVADIGEQLSVSTVGCSLVWTVGLSRSHKSNGTDGGSPSRTRTLHHHSQR